ncbi:PREDICTED: legumin A-like [Brassica oleracea var. oleracea]|uniref:legumin A-like n=1 Tax=Brassica oleracea var. oleracea TaxID=109376 RepID=UPI0006A745E6|nr:PREDICTED: legumin A-like [Brassica oleracea var. oleracea]
MSKALAKVGTAANAVFRTISKAYKNPNTQDTLVNASVELGTSAAKTALEGGSKKTPPSPPSPPSYMYLNTSAMVEQPQGRYPSQPRPLFPCFFPMVSSQTRRTSFVPTNTDLEPQFPEEDFRGEGGSSFSWKMNGSDVGASKMVLLPRGFPQPVFSNGPKMAFVLQGTGTAGIVVPKGNGVLNERVVRISEADVIAVPSGVVTWWFNDNSDTHLAIVFLGQQRLVNFYLAGPRGVFKGFSAEVVCTSLQLGEAVAALLDSQTTHGGIVKLGPELNMPQPNIINRDGLVFNSFTAVLGEGDSSGDAFFLNSTNLPLLNEVGWGASIIQLGSGCIYPPTYACATKFQIILVFSGSGNVEVVGPNGDSIINAAVEKGHLFIVPDTSVLSATAGHIGLSWLSIFNSPTPRFLTLAGRGSVLKSLSQAVVQAAFNVTTPMERKIRFPGQSH